MSDWFDDRDLYNKIGFLVRFDKSVKIYTLIQEYEGKKKSDFRTYIEKKIKESVKDIKLKDITFDDKKQVCKILLLFNIETILGNKESNIRFQFDKYQTQKWDIEHIAPQKENINKRECCKTLYTYIYDKKFPNKFDKEGYCDKFYKKIENKLSIKNIPDNKKDNIGNLTLLDRRTNRSYQNAFYPVKRAIILEQELKGVFIPVATKNVFLKQYSSRLSNMMSWDDNDAEDYRKNIFKLLKKYGVKDE